MISRLDPVSRPSVRGLSARGFTLIELLTVIAVIGILTAISIPVIGGVKDNAKKTKTRVQFGQWAAGVRQFKQVYGYYPRFVDSTNSGNSHKVNGGLAYNESALGDRDYLFRELLSGKPAKLVAGAFTFGSTEKDGTTSIQNTKRQQFVTFDISEIVSTTGDDAADSDLKADGAVKDAFGNVEIAVLVDRNNDGFIDINDRGDASNNYPVLTAKGGRGTLSSAVVDAKIKAADSSQKGVRAEVIFYSPGRGSTSSIQDKDAVWSW